MRDAHAGVSLFFMHMPVRLSFMARAYLLDAVLCVVVFLAFLTVFSIVVVVVVFIAVVVVVVWCLR